MNDDGILQLVTAALNSVAPGWNKDDKPLDMSLKMKDLSIDSVSTMEMVGYIEEELGVTFPDEDLAQVNRLEDLAGLIRNAA
ncbi:MAG: acyl carrier protein [Myxococcota bacterium]|jgi:acyl carrier protein|nr:acyl carrier protein [Myxococcota bacterium]